MPTTNIRYVDKDAAAGGDGTTNALTGANCAYVSLNVWEAARQADLPTGDIIEKVICCSNHANHTADSTAVTIDGWTTDATRYIQIEAEVSHGGAWNTSAYRLSISGTENPLRFIENDVKIIGLQISTQRSTTGYSIGIRLTPTAGAVGSFLIDKCIIKNIGIYQNSSNGAAVLADYVAGTNSWSLDIRNCLLYSDTANNWNGLWVNDADWTVTAYNINTCNLDKGIDRNLGTLTVTNCYVGSCTTEYEGTMTRTTCAHSSSTSYSGSTASVAYSTANFVNVTAGSEDLHLTATSALLNVGTDLSATFTDDIDGQTRPTGAGTWDIGADEYVAAGGTDITPPVGGLAAAGATPWMEFGIIVPTEVDS